MNHTPADLLKLTCKVATQIFFAIYFSGFASAQSISWEEATRNVQALHDQYFEAARERDPNGFPGVSLNGLDAQMHRCAALGRMLGFSSIIGHLEPPLPDLATAAGDELWAAGFSLDAWLTATGHLRALPRRARVELWNNECRRKLVPAQGTEPDSGGRNDQFYQIEEGDTHLIILGAIETGFADRLRAALNNHPETTTVSLGSPGGNVAEAIMAGIMIRRMGLDTVLYSDCASACPLVFIGGVKRRIWLPPSRVGFHQMYRDRGELGITPVAPDDPTYSRVLAYLIAMGVEAGIIYTWMLSAPPESMAYIEPHDLCMAGVATWVQRVCADYEVR